MQNSSFKEKTSHYTHKKEKRITAVRIIYKYTQTSFEGLMNVPDARFDRPLSLELFEITIYHRKVKLTTIWLKKIVNGKIA